MCVVASGGRGCVDSVVWRRGRSSVAAVGSSHAATTSQIVGTTITRTCTVARIILWGVGGRVLVILVARCLWWLLLLQENKVERSACW